MNNFVVKYLENIEIKNYIIKSMYFLYWNNFYINLEWREGGYYGYIGASYVCELSVWKGF